MIGALAVTVSSSPAAAASTTFRAVADTYVNSASPSSVYGTSSTLREDGSPTVRTYVRFTVSGLPGTVTKATLRFYAKSSNSSPSTGYAVASTTWSETSTSWRNAPAVAAALGQSGAVKSGAWISIDVSKAVAGPGTYSFALAESSSTANAFASREAGSATAPQLVVEATSPSPSPSPTSPSPSPSPSGDWQPSFPINAAFYYPWFPEAWNQQGYNPFTNYHPTLGYYDSSNAAVIASHIQSMLYGGMNAGIASWWGQGTATDNRIALLLRGAAGTHFRWTLYYEKESQGDPTVAVLQSDLNYIKSHYGADPSYLRVNGKPVIFVYADAADGCGMADRWKQANTMGFYVVLKVFAGYLTCANQPDGWHQYAPAVDYDSQGQYAVAISPGFWKKGDAVRLARDLSRWSTDVATMKASTARFRLVTTFNEWGEGTSVESAQEWATTSGQGAYLDTLHAAFGTAG
jgi:hypothetical protein